MTPQATLKPLENGVLVSHGSFISGAANERMTVITTQATPIAAQSFKGRSRAGCRGDRQLYIQLNSSHGFW